MEHPFLYIKRHFGYAKVRYRGLSKNTQRLMTLLQLDEGRTVPGGVKPCISAPKIRPNGGETPCQGRL